jgi:hypothetical protein
MAVVSEHPTVIMNEQIKQIYAFSDIHGDADALIILLRDCARVIRKKNSASASASVSSAMQDTSAFNPNKYDDELTGFYMANLDTLGVDILKPDTNNPAYQFDWNYEWCGDSSHVVIVGDLIDLFRPTPPEYKHPSHIVFNDEIRSGTPLPFEYIQIELKIIKFLNEIDKQARKTLGRVISLVGNHEMMNFFGKYRSPNDYISPYQKITGNYYRGQSRIDIFNVGNIGFELFRQGGIRTLLQINDNIFVHGQLTSVTRSEHIALNNHLNSIINYDNSVDYYQKYGSLAYGDGDPKNHIWYREFGDSEAIDARLKNIKPKKYTHTSQAFCGHVTDTIKNYCSGDLDCIAKSGNMRIIIGHCQQNDSTSFDTANITYKTIAKDGNREILSLPVHIGKAEPKNGIVFGITMECPTQDTTGYQIYRVDCGTSRAFDDKGKDAHIEYYDKVTDEYFRKMYLSRTPQLLFINEPNVVIIRSDLANTIIHQPRPWWSQKVKTIASKYSSAGTMSSSAAASVASTQIHSGGKYIMNKYAYTNLRNT